jgi:hypothetical protein
MPRVRRFGLLLYGTLTLAGLVLLITYGILELRPRVERGLRFRALDRQWRDPNLPLAARDKAADQLMEFGDEAMPAYLAALADPNSEVRVTAYFHVTKHRPISREAILACLAALKNDPDPHARKALVLALTSVAQVSGDGGDRRWPIVEAILAAGHDASPVVRLEVMRAMSDDHLAAGADLRPWLDDPDRAVRLAAAAAILQVDPTGKERVIPTVRAMMLDAGLAQHDELDRLHRLLHAADPAVCREFLNGPDVPPRVRDEVLHQLRARLNDLVSPEEAAEVRRLLEDHEKTSSTAAHGGPHPGSAGASVQPTSRFHSRAASLRCCSSRAMSAPRWRRSPSLSLAVGGRFSRRSIDESFRRFFSDAMIADPLACRRCLSRPAHRIIP